MYYSKLNIWYIVHYIPNKTDLKMIELNNQIIKNHDSYFGKYVLMSSTILNLKCLEFLRPFSFS